MNVPPDALDIVTRFAGHAQRQPAAAAIRSDAECVTYRELDRWSSAIARDLAAAGVRTGDGVAVLAARDAATIAGMLGALRAGAWYLLIEPGQTPGRRELLLRRSGCSGPPTWASPPTCASPQALRPCPRGSW